jgi:hypothetical protein
MYFYLLFFSSQVLRQLNVFADEDINAAAEALNDVSFTLSPFSIFLGFSFFSFSKNVSSTLPLFYKKESMKIRKNRTMPRPIVQTNYYRVSRGSIIISWDGKISILLILILFFFFGIFGGIECFCFWSFLEALALDLWTHLNFTLAPICLTCIMVQAL